MIQRSELQRFADRMEEVLKDNDHKGGWDQEDARYLYEYLRDEVKELGAAIRGGKPEEIRKECCDVGNLAMMLFNNHEE